MAWDTERTKQRLLDAATEEFSQHGLAGARVDRIAKNAGVNKERIYQYFGPKDELFGVVLARELVAVIDAVPLQGSGADAIADYAARVFDYHRSNPQFARLQMWEALELNAPANEAVRRAAEGRKVEDICRILPGVSKSDARELLLTIISLVVSWQVLHTLDRLVTATQKRTEARVEERRRAIRRTARELAVSLLSNA